MPDPPPRNAFFNPDRQPSATGGATSGAAVAQQRMKQTTWASRLQQTGTTSKGPCKPSHEHSAMIGTTAAGGSGSATGGNLINSSTSASSLVLPTLLTSSVVNPATAASSKPVTERSAGSGCNTKTEEEETTSRTTSEYGDDTPPVIRRRGRRSSTSSMKRRAMLQRQVAPPVHINPSTDSDCQSPWECPPPLVLSDDERYSCSSGSHRRLHRKCSDVGSEITLGDADGLSQLFDGDSPRTVKSQENKSSFLHVGGTTSTTGSALLKNPAPVTPASIGSNHLNDLSKPPTPQITSPKPGNPNAKPYHPVIRDKERFVQRVSQQQKKTMNNNEEQLRDMTIFSGKEMSDIMDYFLTNVGDRKNKKSSSSSSSSQCGLTKAKHQEFHSELAKKRFAQYDDHSSSTKMGESASHLFGRRNSNADCLRGRSDSTDSKATTRSAPNACRLVKVAAGEFSSEAAADSRGATPCSQRSAPAQKLRSVNRALLATHTASFVGADKEQEAVEPIASSSTAPVFVSGTSIELQQNTSCSSPSLADSCAVAAVKAGTSADLDGAGTMGSGFVLAASTEEDVAPPSGEERAAFGTEPVDLAAGLGESTGGEQQKKSSACSSISTTTALVSSSAAGENAAAAAVSQTVPTTGEDEQSVQMKKRSGNNHGATMGGSAKATNACEQQGRNSTVKETAEELVTENNIGSTPIEKQELSASKNLPDEHGQSTAAKPDSIGTTESKKSSTTSPELTRKATNLASAVSSTKLEDACAANLAAANCSPTTSSTTCSPQTTSTGHNFSTSPTRSVKPSFLATLTGKNKISTSVQVEMRREKEPGGFSTTASGYGVVGTSLLSSSGNKQSMVTSSCTQLPFTTSSGNMARGCTTAGSSTSAAGQQQGAASMSMQGNTFTSWIGDSKGKQNSCSPTLPPPLSSTKHFPELSASQSSLTLSPPNGRDGQLSSRSSGSAEGELHHGKTNQGGKQAKSSRVGAATSTSSAQQSENKLSPAPAQPGSSSSSGSSTTGSPNQSSKSVQQANIKQGGPSSTGTTSNSMMNTASSTCSTTVCSKTATVNKATSSASTSISSTENTTKVDQQHLPTSSPAAPEQLVRTSWSAKMQQNKSTSSAGAPATASANGNNSTSFQPAPRTAATSKQQGGSSSTSTTTSSRGPVTSASCNLVQQQQQRQKDHTTASTTVNSAKSSCKNNTTTTSSKNYSLSTSSGGSTTVERKETTLDEPVCLLGPEVMPLESVSVSTSGATGSGPAHAKNGVPGDESFGASPRRRTRPVDRSRLLQQSRDNMRNQRANRQQGSAASTGVPGGTTGTIGSLNAQSANRQHLRG
ncbi:unnamed protein product [Amoebophrya sp. A120]|nr:unnamed protein product [Amoebophrya sp. A120]|eukprot:GSA120T00023370001.1